MGAAGLTSSSVEMADKGGVGIELDLSKVPCREEGMTPYEMMLSESQERMLMVLKPGREAEAEAIFRKWELDFAVIGEVTDTKHLVLTFEGGTVADIPLGPLGDNAPLYDRPHDPLTKPAPLGPVEAVNSVTHDLMMLMGSPDLASRRWIWEQYDHMVMADTIGRPGGDAAMVRVHGTKKALAITTDCTPRYCFADPVEGGKQAIAEAYRNITAVGATPLAVTDCMNFGNPERPEIMAQFVGCIEGMAEACSTLDMPVVSGNVSLYNETNGVGVLPTPAIGAVGLIDDYDKRTDIAFKAQGDTIFLVGDTRGHLGQSLWLRYVAGREEGPPPPVDLDAELSAGNFVRGLVLEGTASAVHDCADGGALVAVAEMALAGGRGCTLAEPRFIEEPFDGGAHAAWFGEDQARYIVTTSDPEKLANMAKAAGVKVHRLGNVAGTEDAAIAIDGEQVSLDALYAAHENFLPDLMER